MKTITFQPNEPQVLSLQETAGVLDGFYVLYETSDGRLLTLPRPAAVKLNQLDPAPGEEFTATKHQEGKQPAEWVFSLTAKSENLRAAKETQEADQKARELAAATRKDLPRQLEASILRQMPKSSRAAVAEVPDEQKGTGTYGPVPQLAPVGRKTKPEAVPFNIAFVEVTRFVTEGLKSVGEQWNDQAKQDAICSVLISASRQGLLSLWEREV
jgi:hypothetical protein